MSEMKLGTVHPTALISPKAKLGEGVTVGPYSVIHEGVELGEGSVVGAFCLLGEPTADFYSCDSYDNAPLKIGRKALIRSHSVFYSNSTIGDHFECGHHVTVREESEIGDHCRIGTLSDVQGKCKMGDYVRLHSNVFVAQGCTFGDYVWVFPHAVLTDDPQPPSERVKGVTVDDFGVISAQAVILSGVHLGKDALAGAATLVRHDIPAEAVVVGVPGKQIASVRDIRAADGQPVYPWRQHFDRGMPWKGIGYDEWASQIGRKDLDNPSTVSEEGSRDS